MYHLYNGLAHTSITHQNDKAHQLGIGALTTFAGDDVPLLWGADNDLGGTDLLLAQLVIPSQFCHIDAISGQALGRSPEGLDQAIGIWLGEDLGRRDSGLPLWEAGLDHPMLPKTLNAFSRP